MPGRVVFFLQSASYEPAWQAASMAITAVAMGDEVYVVFAFEALRELARGSFGQPQNEQERAERARADELGVPSPPRMLEEARELGARFLACETTLKLCGLLPKDLEGRLEIMGLPSIWRLTEGARTLAL